MALNPVACTEEGRHMTGEGLLHPFLANLIPYERVYGYQEKAIRTILGGQTRESPLRHSPGGGGVQWCNDSMIQ